MFHICLQEEERKNEHYDSRPGRQSGLPTLPGITTAWRPAPHSLREFPQEATSHRCVPAWAQVQGSPYRAWPGWALTRNYGNKWPDSLIVQRGGIGQATGGVGGGTGSMGRSGSLPKSGVGEFWVGGPTFPWALVSDCAERGPWRPVAGDRVHCPWARPARKSTL